MNTFKLALRGLTRNRRRSLVTLLAIALRLHGHRVVCRLYPRRFYGIAQQSIHGELLGHLTLSKRGMRMEGKLDPERYMLTTGEVEQITKLVEEAEPHVKMVAPRLAFSGLISNGRASTMPLPKRLSRQRWKGCSRARSAMLARRVACWTSGRKGSIRRTMMWSS